MNLALKNTFKILMYLCKKDKKGLIQSSYIYFFMSILKRQHRLTLKYIDKHVENIHLKVNYVQEAEFRLNTIY